MSDFSPSAQAVFWAFNSKFDWIEDGVPGSQCKAIASALRAAADQVVPWEMWLGTDETCYAYYRQRRNTRRQLLAIADELEQLVNN